MQRIFWIAMALALGRAPWLGAEPLDEAKAAYEAGHYDVAVQILQDAAKTGDPKAQCGLGVMFEHGRGLPADLGKAVEWYLKSAAQGNASAENNLGYLYFNGLGVAKSYDQAFEWYSKAVEALTTKDHWDESIAWTNMGNMYFWGHG